MTQFNGKENTLGHQAKTEHIVRLEVQRRHAKGSLRVIDTMIREVDDQLLYVSQFKKEWLQHRKQLEAARQDIMMKETTVRLDTEEKFLRVLDQIARGKPQLKVERSTSRILESPQ